MGSIACANMHVNMHANDMFTVVPNITIAGSDGGWFMIVFITFGLKEKCLFFATHNICDISDCIFIFYQLLAV